MQRRRALLAKRYAGRILPPHTTGHGETTYIPVKQTNMLASEDDRDARRAVLLGRDRKRQQYIADLRRIAAEPPAPARERVRPRRKTTRGMWRSGRSCGRVSRVTPSWAGVRKVVRAERRKQRAA